MWIIVVVYAIIVLYMYVHVHVGMFLCVCMCMLVFCLRFHKLWNRNDSVVHTHLCTIALYKFNAYDHNHISNTQHVILPLVKSFAAVESQWFYELVCILLSINIILVRPVIAMVPWFYIVYTKHCPMSLVQWFWCVVCVDEISIFCYLFISPIITNL